ncbi:MAG: hypothetical protein OES99_04930 [Gammaproteobacteria bacterium]|nr:hypothetical protein [Gammaproteobacteria bacterium]
MKIRALGAAVIMVFAGMPAMAGFISVDRAAFAAAVADGTISSEDFEGFAPGDLLGVTAELTYSASLGDPVVTGFLTTTSPNGLGSTSVSGGPTVDEFFLIEENAAFAFTEAITAFAIDINTFARGDAAYSASTNTGDVITSLFEVFPGETTGQFIGFVSDTPFTSVTIAALSGFSFTLDTLVYGDASAVVVPLPGTVLLLLGGLPALSLTRKTACPCQ